MATAMFTAPSPILCCLLALHLAHAPVPVWDADDVAEPWVGCHVSGESAGAWDLDVLLLGVYPPEDLDDGPFGSFPDCPQRSALGEPYPLARGAGPNIASLDGGLGGLLWAPTVRLVAAGPTDAVPFRAGDPAPVPPAARRALLGVLVI